MMRIYPGPGGANLAFPNVKAGNHVPWEPLTEDLFDVGYWRSDLGITLVGSRVSAWADQSGSGRHFTQADNTYRPEYTAGALNGQPSLDFNASVVTHMGCSINVPTDHTIWVVFKATNGILDTANLLFGGVPMVRINDENDRPSVYYAAGSYNPGATTVADGVWRSLRWMRDVTNFYLAYSSGADQTASSAGLPTSGTWIYLGAGASQSFDGEIVELGIRSSVLTAPQISNLNAYRLSRYGL